MTPARSGSTTAAPAWADALPGAVSTSETDRARMAPDASHYLLRPRAVATPRDLAEVAALMAGVSAMADPVPLTFRSGGTSLSGQAVTDGLLVDVRRHQADVEVLDDGARVRCQPGAVLRRVNTALARYGRRLGPDPASEIACTLGGVIANNSSGMTAGTTTTAYRTLESMVLVLPSGTVVDTAAPDADARLHEREPELHAGLLRLRDTVRADPRLRATIEHQFSMKNTMGYGLNSLLDHDSAVEILAHLVVGSEGTLAYVGEVTLRTVPALPHAATTLLVLDSIDRATDALPALTAAGAVAIELMDASSLRVAQRDARADAFLRGLRVEEHTALLVELQHADADGLVALRGRLEPVLGTLGVSAAAPLTSDPAARAAMWHVRKGLYATVAGARPTGTTALLEDVVVPPAALTGTVRALRALLARYGYDDAVTFGHARDANLHFMINPRLDEQRELDAYAAFTEDLVDLVLGADGSLKAEHGTGRIMAPFVRRQYGDELYDVMREIKRLCDPRGLLNPGVLLSEDPRAHLRDVKAYPAVHPELDRCVECGYCEPACPSRNTTTTPRQRIVLLREIARAEPARRRELERDYDYASVQTCAADSLCAVSCPVDIDTGAVMKGLRAKSRGPVVQALGAGAARAWGPATAALRGALGVADVLPGAALSGASRAARAVVGSRGRDWVPQVDDALPGPGQARSRLRRGAPDAPDVVFFPACIGALFGPEGSGGGVGEAFVRLCERAGLSVAIPDGIDGLCCGTVWESKGLADGAATMARRVAAAVWDLTDEGRLPLVSDASSCTHGLAGIGTSLRGEDARRWARLRVVDAVTFAREQVLPALDVPADRRIERLVVHPTCSAVHLGTVEDLAEVARAAAHAVTVPVGWGCCGTAGDRGMLHPELPAGATELEAAEIAGLERADGPFDSYVSCNRTCEMGMTAATGRPYRHVLEVLEEVTR